MAATDAAVKDLLPSRTKVNPTYWVGVVERSSIILTNVKVILSTSSKRTGLTNKKLGMATKKRIDEHELIRYKLDNRTKKLQTEERRPCGEDDEDDDDGDGSD